MKSHFVASILFSALALAHASPTALTPATDAVPSKSKTVGAPVKRPLPSPASAASTPNADSVSGLAAQGSQSTSTGASSLRGLATPNSYKLTQGLTVRSTLVAWAQQEGWTFLPEHYAVSVDIPVLANSDLGADFKGAVRMLLDSTALGDTPLQPCFYSNRVLRVVLRSERCDRL